MGSEVSHFDLAPDPVTDRVAVTAWALAAGQYRLILELQGQQGEPLGQNHYSFYRGER